jgi:hypothetical protein
LHNLRALYVFLYMYFDHLLPKSANLFSLILYFKLFKIKNTWIWASNCHKLLVLFAFNKYEYIYPKCKVFDNTCKVFDNTWHTKRCFILLKIQSSVINGRLTKTSLHFT